MSAGIMARKAGMTQIFTDKGEAVAVTVLNVEPNKVVMRRTTAKEGYEAIQVGFGVAPRQQTRAAQGHFAKHGQEAMAGLKEFRVGPDDAFDIGQALTAEMFAAGQMVDVTGLSKGRGFAGVMKRYNFAGGRASHGAEKTHRQMGSTGQCQDPGRVFPGKKMPGHFGSKRVTTQNLEIVRVDAEANRLLVKGAVPGPKGGLVQVRPAVKGA